MSISLQDDFVTGAQSDQIQQTMVQNEVVKENIMVNVSGELNNLSLKGWTKLAEHIGRPRATTLLWYHLKATHDIDAKIVFGSPKELDTAIAVKEPSWGDTPFSTVNIKGVRYYIIDPMMPAIVSDFKYGDMFDEPGETYLQYNYFRLFPEDIDAVKQWTRKTGVILDTLTPLAGGLQTLQNQSEYLNSIPDIIRLYLTSVFTAFVSIACPFIIRVTVIVYLPEGLIPLTFSGIVTLTGISYVSPGLMSALYLSENSFFALSPIHA